MVSQFALPRRALGRTGLQVSVLGLGTAPLGDLYAHLDDCTAIAVPERAFDLGINLLDTSPLLRERSVRASLRDGDQARAAPGHRTCSGIKLMRIEAFEE